MKNYEQPIIEIIAFAEDIVTTSGGDSFESFPESWV